MQLVKQEINTTMKIGQDGERRKLRRQVNLNWKLITTHVKVTY